MASNASWLWPSLRPSSRAREKALSENEAELDKLRKDVQSKTEEINSLDRELGSFKDRVKYYMGGPRSWTRG